MHVWYDTREGFEHDKYPTIGWLFPCFICSSPTSKYKTIVNTNIGDIDVQCCKNCNIEGLTIRNFNSKYFIQYTDDTHSNR